MDSTTPGSTEPEDELMTTLGNGRVLDVDEAAGSALLEFTCAPEMCHSGGVAQGGFVAGWLDGAMAHACIARYTTAFWIATLEMKISYFRPTPPGIVLARGWIERAGKQIVFAEAELRNEAGDVLAKANSTISLVPNRNP